MSWITNIVLKNERGKGNSIKPDWHMLRTAGDGGEARLQWWSITSVSTFLRLYFSLAQTEGKADMVAHPCSSGTWEQWPGQLECSALLSHITAQAEPRIHATLPKN